MIRKQDVLSQDAVGQASLITQDALSSEKLMQMVRGRADQVNGKIGAITTLASEELVSSTQYGRRAPFSGVPTLVKDLLPVKGMAWTLGSSFYSMQKATHSAPLVKRMMRAGFRIIGKSATSEFGLSPIGTSALHGACRSPLNVDYDAGGSSGGAAAAVAAGIVAIAQGGDGGGSLRIPAAVNGLIGLKGSRGLFPQAPSPAIDGLLSHGAITKSTRDMRAFLAATTGNVAGDRWRMNQVDFLRAPIRSPKRPWKIGVAAQGLFGAIQCDEAIASAVACGELLEALGCQVETCELDLNHELIIESFTKLFAIGAGTAIATIGRDPHDPALEHEFEEWSLLLAQEGWQLSALDAAETWGALQPEITRFSEALRTYDFVLTPTLGFPGLKVDEAYETERYFEFVDSAPMANVSGCPAITVPFSFSRDSLGLGVQLFADWGRDVALLDIADLIIPDGIAQPSIDARIQQASEVTN